MDTQALVTLENRFSLQGYQRLAQELCKTAQFEGSGVRIERAGNYVFEPYREFISDITRIGKYRDPEGVQLDILVVKAKKPQHLERARTMLRNTVAEYLKKQTENAAADRFRALVAYHADGSDSWRLSFVRYEVKAITDGNKYKIVGEKTPPKRYSYLVGEGEPIHTAKQQLAELLSSRTPPSIEAIEKSFSVERVTQEFYQKYQALYTNLLKSLEKQVSANAALKMEFKSKGIQTAAFAKKLLGQIVFLYFLQKKGWLGLQEGQSYGQGDKHFLRSRFNSTSNYFDDFLKYLFYEALADKRTTDYYKRFECRIPFLNGGLFEPEKGFDWKSISLNLPNEIFSNKKGSTEGSGILDVFDLYNFTVREDEPLEREVAVDPEMLGKVFENLLEEEERGASGTFYTPREIVHYMCQQSLVYYLHGKMKAPASVLEIGSSQTKLLSSTDGTGQMTLEQRLESEGLTTDILSRFIKEADRHQFDERKSTEEDRQWLEQHIRPNAAALDQALADIKVCDPAVGSGAFPVGMMSEIVNARYALSSFLPTDESRTVYHFKRHCIQNSLYGVDIKEEAIEIAKLRLWLSLVVDEENIGSIKPLPNLDYKLVRGNALLDYELKAAGELGKGGEPTHARLLKLKDALFNATDADQKASLRSQLHEELKQLTGEANSFGFRVQFAEVFAVNGGFDVLVANPPYVRQEKIKDIKPQLQGRYQQVYTGTADLLVYFFGKGVELLRPNGILTLITSNKWMRSGYGEKLRAYLKEKVNLEELIDFGDKPVFEAIAYPSVLVARKGKPDGAFRAMTVDSVEEMRTFEETFQHKRIVMQQPTLDTKGWRIESDEDARLLAKLRENSIPLKEYVKGRIYYGIKTGLNEAFVVDEATKNALIAADPRSAEVLKPYLRGRDIKRYEIHDPKLWLIFTRRGIDIKQYPAIYQHLRHWRVELEPAPDRTFKTWASVETYVNELSPRPLAKWSPADRSKPVKWPGRKGGTYQWYEIQDNIAYHEEFNIRKIIYQEIASHQAFALDSNGYYVNNKVFLIIPPHPGLIHLLNSKVAWFYFSKVCTRMVGGALAMQSIFIENFPIPLALSFDDLQSIDQNEESFARIDKIILDAYDLSAGEQF